MEWCKGEVFKTESKQFAQRDFGEGTCIAVRIDGAIVGRGFAKMHNGKLSYETGRPCRSPKLVQGNDVERQDDSIGPQQPQQFLKCAASGGTLKNNLPVRLAVACDRIEIPSPLVRDAKRSGQHARQNVADRGREHEDGFRLGRQLISD